jgi:PadR family transcriptional regulator PadR
MDESQMLKGLLEGCILAIISREETYGYAILSDLEEAGMEDINEGTLYPILKRLEQKEHIQCRIGISPYGPKRKYFSITEKGSTYLAQWKASYQKLISSANQIIWEDRT